jgi:hypothetical protein
MADNNLGRFVIIPSGTWDGGTAYKALNAVYLNGNSYLAILPSTNKNPETEPTYWQLLASKGSQDIVDAAEAARDLAEGYAAQLGVYSQIINVLSEGVVGDGSDETVAMQAALDKAVAVNGIFYVPAGLTVTVDQLALTSETDFSVQIDGTIKRVNSSASPHGMLTLLGCDHFDIISLNGDGNVANNGVTVSEHQHILTIAGCTDAHFGTITGVNVAGDVVYMDGANARLQFDCIQGYSADTGRNTVSIIKGEALQFGKIMSVGVGHTSMPGGVDVEPNTNTDHCRYIQFGEVYVETNGLGGFMLTNNNGATCEYAQANNVIVRKKTITRVGVNSTNVGIAVNNFDYAHVTGSVTEIQATKASLSTMALSVDGGRCNIIKVNANNVHYGAMVGYYDSCTQLDLDFSAYRVYGFGLDAANITDSTIQVDIVDSGYGETTGTACILLEIGTTQSNVMYKGLLKKCTYGDAGIYYTPGTRTDITFDVDIEGFAVANYTTDNVSMLAYNMRPEIWHNLTLGGDWVADGSGDLFTPSFMKDVHGEVHMKGALVNGTATAGSTVATALPAPITPSKHRVFPSIRGGSIYVASFGAIMVDSLIIGNMIELSNVHYHAD